MKRFLIGLLFCVQVNFAYAVEQSQYYGGYSAICTYGESISSCAGGISGKYGTGFYGGLNWKNPITGITYNISTNGNTVVLSGGDLSTSIAFPGITTAGSGSRPYVGYPAFSSINIQTTDNSNIRVALYTSNSRSFTEVVSQSRACVSYPGMTSDPSLYYCLDREVVNLKVSTRTYFSR